MDYLETNFKKLNELLEKGKKGKYKIPLREISVQLTNKCNNYCLMCPLCKKEYKNRTYYNQQPYIVDLTQFKKIFPLNNFFNKIIKKTNKLNGANFMFSTGETFINPNVYEIFKYAKKNYPKSKISIVSNGTLPPKPLDIVKYIDFIGFSFDGATAETFNKIRTPSNFNHVLEVITKWEDAANKFNNKFTFSFSVTLSSLNITELPDIVKIASRFKRISSIFVQPVIIRKHQKELEYLLLKNIDKKIIKQTIEETKKISQETGVIINGLEQLLIEGDLENTNSEMFSKYCRFFWNGIMTLGANGNIKHLCCFFSEDDDSDKLIRKYKIPVDKTPFEIYNSKEYWKLREDLINGKLSYYCRNCTINIGAYNTMAQKPLDMESDFFL